MTKKILVIQSESLRAFIDALGGMADIRRKHADDHITLLTMKPFVDVATRSRYFDEVKILKGGLLAKILSRFFAALKYDQVYNLEKYAVDAPPPDLSWMKTDVEFFGLKKPYVLLFPGGDKGGWPQAKYTALALQLQRHGYMVAALGSDRERALFNRINRIAPETKDLSGRTSLFDIASLAGNAAAAVGNDVAPMRLAALAGCPFVAVVDENMLVKDVFNSIDREAAA